MVLHFNVFQNNPLSANPKNWSSTLKKFFGIFADELFECVWPFWDTGA